MAIGCPRVVAGHPIERAIEVSDARPAAGRDVLLLYPVSNTKRADVAANTMTLASLLLLFPLPLFSFLSGFCQDYNPAVQDPFTGYCKESLYTLYRGRLNGALVNSDLTVSRTEGTSFGCPPGLSH